MAGALRCLCLLLCLGLSTPSNAQDRTAQFQTATDLMAQGATDRALPLIEKLVSAEPNNKFYRFQLAVALYQLGQDGRARFHFDRLRGAALTPRERQLVLGYLNQIDARKVWSATFSFNIKPESNGIKQTENHTLMLGDLPLTLNDTAIGKPTVSTIIAPGFSYTPTLREGLKAQFSLSAYLKYNDEKALRDYQLTGRAGLYLQRDARQASYGGLLLGVRRVADRPYSQTAGLYAGRGQRIGERGTLRFGSEVTREFRRDGRADIDRLFLSADYAHVVAPNLQLSIGGFAEKTDSDSATEAGHRLALSAGGLYAFEGGLMAGLSLRGELDDRDGINGLFGVARSDRTLALDLRLYHRDFTIGTFAPELVMGIERNRSNIPLADYTNRYLSVGLTRNF
ncbi:MAG: surface lipoprotein assembly modifier [Sulfitobacter sp.]|nr:surface lipoprotein assembly modifier [Sulfitobacter sp.]